jgi:hypothetical protein
MADDWVMYKAVPKAPGANFEQYKAKPKAQPEMNEQGQLDALKKQHPLMYKLAEYLQGSPALEKAGNIAGHINNIVEGTGLPSLSKGFYGTGLDIARGIGNIPADILEATGHKVNPIKAPWLGQVYPIPKQQYKELNVNPYVGEGMETIGSLGMGLPVYRGYQAVKKGIEALPFVKKIPELIRNVLAGSGVGAAISPDNRGLGAALGGGAETVPFAIRGAKNYFQGRNTSGREKDLYKAMREHEMQKADLESLKNLSTHRFDKNNPEALLLSAQDKAAQLEEAEAFKRRHFPDEKMLPGQQLVPEAEYGVKNVNEVLKHTLREGGTHSQDLSQHVVNAIEGVPVLEPHPKTGLLREVRKGGLREEIGSKYDKLEESLPDIKIPGSPDMEAVEKELKKYIGEKANLTEEQKESFRKALAATHPSNKDKTINGKQFFRAYRSLKRMEGNQRSKAFGLSPKEHDEWIERANETKKTYENMEKIIEQHFPKDTIKTLHEINHEYSNKVAPLHENPMYQQMLKHGRYTGDMAEALSGTTPGNKILNNLIQGNPELSRLVIGHSFAENPAKLMKPNKAIEPFVRANPQIAELMGHQKAAASALESAKRNEEMYKHIENIPKLGKEIHEQRMLAKRLKQESEVTGLTKAEVAKKKIEYEKAQQKLRALKSKLIGASVLGTAVGYTAKKIRE